MNRKTSCWTMPMLRRSEASVTSRMSWPSIVMRAAGDVVEARQQVDDRRLAAAGGPEQRDHLAGLGIDVDVVEHGADRVVAEADVVEAHLALDVLELDASGFSLTADSASRISKIRSPAACDRANWLTMKPTWRIGTWMSCR